MYFLYFIQRYSMIGGECKMNHCVTFRIIAIFLFFLIFDFYVELERSLTADVFNIYIVNILKLNRSSTLRTRIRDVWGSNGGKI